MKNNSLQSQEMVVIADYGHCFLLFVSFQSDIFNCNYVVSFYVPIFHAGLKRYVVYGLFCNRFACIFMKYMGKNKMSWVVGD